MNRSFEKLDFEDKRDRSLRRAMAESAIPDEGEPLVTEMEEEKSPDQILFEKAFEEAEDEQTLYNHLNRLLDNHEFTTISKYSQSLLVKKGVTEAKNLDYEDPTVALAIAEAVNLAAKTIDYNFYQLKSAMIVAAWKIGAKFGYNRDDDTYSLFDPSIGTASFHDPGGEIKEIIGDLLKEEEPIWQYKWSGIGRQDDAFDILKNLGDLKKMDSLIAELIRATTPTELKGAGIDFRSRVKVVPPKVVIEEERQEDSLIEMYGRGSLQVTLRDFVLASEDEKVRALLKGLQGRHSV